MTDTNNSASEWTTVVTYEGFIKYPVKDATPADVSRLRKLLPEGLKVEEVRCVYPAGYALNGRLEFREIP